MRSSSWSTTPRAHSSTTRSSSGFSGGSRTAWTGSSPAFRSDDTVKRVEGGLVAETIDREMLVAVQTPQAFRADRLRAAHAASAAELAGATDCASLVERAGGRIAIVPGERRLVKVTTADDLDLVARLLAAEAE